MRSGLSSQRAGRAGFRRRTTLLAAGPLVLGAALAVPSPAGAQDPGLLRQIEESRRRLEQVRQERLLLQQEMSSLRSRVRNVSSELEDIERLLSASRSVVAEIEFQLDATAEQIDLVEAELLRTRELLEDETLILHRRLREIYKRGPLHAARVLLGADSFAELLTRYRYLRLITSYDKALVDRVADLEAELVAQQRELRAFRVELDRLRNAQLSEVQALRGVEQQRQERLDTYRRQERAAQSRLAELDADESRLNGLIRDLERRRTSGAAGAELPSSGPTTLSPADRGSLPWPVEGGSILYRFGPRVGPDGTSLTSSGLGIRAPAGAPVRAVRGGRVVLAGPFEGYGPTVVVSHGGGYYTLYLYLEEIGVVEGREIEVGQVVGTVGGASTPDGPHLELQIRAPSEEGTPEAVDPLPWLGGGASIPAILPFPARDPSVAFRRMTW